MKIRHDIDPDVVDAAVLIVSRWVHSPGVLEVVLKMYREANSIEYFNDERINKLEQEMLSLITDQIIGKWN